MNKDNKTRIQNILQFVIIMVTVILIYLNVCVLQPRGNKYTNKRLLKNTVKKKTKVKDSKQNVLNVESAHQKKKQSLK